MEAPLLPGLPSWVWPLMSFCSPPHILLWDSDFYTWPSLGLHCSLLPCSGGSEPARPGGSRKLIFVRTWWSQNSPGLGCWNSRYLPLRSPYLVPSISHDNLTKRHRASLKFAVLKCSEKLYKAPSFVSFCRICHAGVPNPIYKASLLSCLVCIWEHCVSL